MTREEAIRILDPETTAAALAEIECYGGFNGAEAKVAACDEACRIAVAALRAQQEAEKNDPLTIDELEQMEGSHVWCVPIPESLTSGYGLVERGHIKIPVPSEWSHICYLEEYGKLWLAYRHKPKEGTT